VITLVLVVLAASGTFLLHTALAFGWHGLGVGPCAGGTSRATWARLVARLRVWLAQAGLAEVPVRSFVATVAGFALAGATVAFALFGGVLAALVAGGFAATFPVAGARARRRDRRAAAEEAWPRLIEEIRILTGSVGRSIPQALFEVGRAGPPELRPAFDAAHREWRISTDFERTLSVLKQQLADPAADVIAETLLIAHELGGTDLDRRLADLADDRRADVQYRRDARAQQAGVRFARRFVLLVPLGMAAAGLSVGTGRDAYETPLGQVIVVVALGMVAVCWVWAGRLLRLPDEERVFDERPRIEVDR
jgi:tight adherence protein B